MSQPSNKRSPCPPRFPEAVAACRPRAACRGCQVDPGAGSHSPSGLQLCPSDIFSRVRKPTVYKLVLVSTSTYRAGPRGGCEQVSSAPGTADAASASCGPMGHCPTCRDTGQDQAGAIGWHPALGPMALGEPLTIPVTISRAHLVPDCTRLPSVHPLFCMGAAIPLSPWRESEEY